VDGKTWTPDTKQKNDDPTYPNHTAEVDKDRELGFAVTYDSPLAPRQIHDTLRATEKKDVSVKVVEEFRTLLIVDKKVTAHAKWKASFETGDTEVKFSDGSTGKGPPGEWTTLKGVIKKEFPKQNVVDVD
jgi:hypothetical protein